MELQIKHTNVFSRNLKAYENNWRYIINCGGSRSSKSYSLMQLFIYICITEPGTSISIVRKSFPSLRDSALRDFKELMSDYGMYDVNKHNKTEQRYEFDNKSSINFFSVDDSKKVKGRKRDICYCNEINELTYDDFQQLALRTSKCLFLDFNPDTDHFIYELMKRDNAITIKSTYKDNIFLGKEIVDEIENLINVDHNYYLIYALGEKPIPNTKIYTHFKEYDNDVILDDWCYGLDFGYNHPSALVKVGQYDEDIYVEELLYMNKLTSADLIKEMNKLNIDKRKIIWADYARPEIIEDIKRAGYNVKEANKAVADGIMSVKMSNIYLHKESINAWREYKSYFWKTNKDIILDEPVKINDDIMDAMRYAIHSMDRRDKKKYNIKFLGFR
jgi:phage terminase large subunit